MDNFSFSMEAESVINLFVNKDVVVYVEGPDDIPFWEYIFDEFSGIDAEFRDVGGCEELTPFIQAISKDELRAIVATDTDFRPFKEGRVEHPNILMTPKYAIENTMISDAIVIDSIVSLAKVSKKKVNLQSYKEWYGDFIEKIGHLVLIDIYNAKHNLGLKVITDNADRFFTSKDSCVFSQEKIDSYINELMRKIGQDVDFTSVKTEALLASNSNQIQDFLRGHFLFSAVTKYIRTYIKSIGVNIQIPNHSFYSTFLLSLKNQFHLHDDYHYFKTKVNNLTLDS
ncbi:DUF4435 domain-containing protein [Shewanella xiamenensis]|uniref:DUF4435 domain-containing protein n=1 Tax=Shewanella xiamenensis TaxID=332186 RepID=A0ABT6UE47_9GAMM|nr:DUF4435 domain-containing protein [Shewanella xiamenensis]MDI5832293.1 DUF4435 domain-containing protein [Shewanella xiamenensis]